jgi:hypothetical protein
VSFRSQQAPAYGPGGDEACTKWALTYQFTAAMKMLRTVDVSHVAC